MTVNGCLYTLQPAQRTLCHASYVALRARQEERVNGHTAREERERERGGGKERGREREEGRYDLKCSLKSVDYLNC